MNSDTTCLIQASGANRPQVLPVSCSLITAYHAVVSCELCVLPHSGAASLHTFYIYLCVNDRRK
jgi:hypothetical protein